MPLFGPLDSLMSYDPHRVVSPALYGVDPGALDYARDLPRPVPRAILLPAPSTQPAGTPSATSAVPATAAAPQPAMTSFGTFTTRRTQLFGPLSGLSI